MEEKEKIEAFNGHIFGIFKTNSIAVNQDKTAVYNMLAKINHSCSPNAVSFAKKENENMKELRSLVRIDKGTEISIGYINLEMFLKREERRQLLFGRWK